MTDNKNNKWILQVNDGRLAPFFMLYVNFWINKVILYYLIINSQSNKWKNLSHKPVEITETREDEGKRSKPRHNKPEKLQKGQSSILEYFRKEHMRVVQEKLLSMGQS